MKKSVLGRTGLEVARLGYGAMGIRGPNTWGVRTVSEQHAGRILNAVLDAGINFIDTSPDYGISEERIGRHIRSRRDEFYLATKCGCVVTDKGDHVELDHVWRRDVIEGNLRASLKRLRTDYVDVLQFHGGTPEELESAGLIKLLEDFRRQGRVRFIGISTRLPYLPAFIDLGVFDTFQIPYSCLEPEHHDWITAAAGQGAGIIIRGGVAKGGPEAEIGRPALNELWQRARLAELLEPDMKPAELILRYTLSHPHCHTSIVGTCSQEHLAENLAAAEKGPLPPDLYEAVRSRTA